MSYDPRSPSDAADMAPDTGPILPRDYDTDQSYCPQCGEPCDGANVEAYELSGEAVCDDCAEAIFEENSQFGAGA